MALYNTAAGIAVAVPALIFYRHFRARIDVMIVDMEQQGHQTGRNHPRGSRVNFRKDTSARKWKSLHPADRFAGDPDLPDGHHHVFEIQRTSDQSAGGERRQIARPAASAQYRVDASGNYSINNAAVKFGSVDNFATVLRETATAQGMKGPGHRHRRDAGATHQAVVNVMEASRLAGLTKISSPHRRAPK